MCLLTSSPGLVLVSGLWCWSLVSGLWSLVLASGPGLWSWSLVLVSGAGLWSPVLVSGLRCWSLVLVSGPGLWSWSLVLVSGAGLSPDIDECERLPPPCAHTCSNTPGSFRCRCPPGRLLLGDGRSCAGLERLSAQSYQSLLYGYQASQGSSERLYHSLASHSFHSRTGQDRGPGPRRPRRASGAWGPGGGASGASGVRGPSGCPQGFELRAGRCLGNAERPQRTSY